MTTTGFRTIPVTRLEAEARVPTAGHTADARPTNARVAAGGRAPLTCSTAQRKVRAAEESLSVAQARLAELGAEQDEEVLAQLDKSQAAVREARQTRDELAQRWAAAVAAFRLTRRGSNR